MSILIILLVLLIAGVLVYIIDRFLPMDATIKLIFRIVVIIVLIIFLLKAFGVWGTLSNVKV
jgi:hypothetical protein